MRPPIDALLAQDAEPLRVRVASWNLQSCRAGLERVGEQLAAVEVDVVGLQEVDRFTTRSGPVDQAAWLSRTLGYAHHAFFRATTKHRGDYGLALLSRWPLSGLRIGLLPSRNAEPRILASAVCRTPRGELAVHVTHLSHLGTNRRVRLDQARFVARRLSSRTMPQLLMGDLNDLDGGEVYGTVADGLVDVFAKVGRGPGGTHQLPLGLPSVRIDYVLASDELVPQGSRVLQTRASDHHMLLAELRLAGRSDINDWCA